MDDYTKWYISEYNKIVNKDEVVNIANEKWFETALNKVPFLYGIWRQEVLDTLRNEVIPHKTNYICTVFKILRGDYQTIYGYLYSTFNKNIKHKYVCAGPTYLSCDGEYRKGFIRYEQINWLKDKYPEVYSIIEAHFLRQLTEEKIMIRSITYFPDNVSKHSKFESDINDKRIPINLYITAWIGEYYRVKMDHPANHLIPGYVNAMFSKYDKLIHDKIMKILGKESWDISPKTQVLYKSSDINFSPTKVGQKIIPLKVGDMENYGDINYAPWRETFINSLVGDLVINGISPSFPLMSNFFFIPTSHPDIYDNAMNRIKSTHSQIAQAIVKKLENTRTDTYSDRTNMFISVKMENLSDAIEIPMDYAEKEIVLADKTLCILLENIGLTVADIPNMMKIEQWKIGTGNMFKNFNVFSKYIFEWIYALYCMNTKLGLIHGDLHLNNFTIFRAVPITKLGTQFIYSNNNYVAYRIGGSIYILPHYGRYSGIIDFSRSFMSSEIIHQHYNDVEAETQIDIQRRRIMKAYASEMPEFYKEFGPEVEIMMLRNYDVGFQIMTALDSHRLSRGIASLINGHPEIKTNLKCIKLLEDIQNMARYYLRDITKKVVAGELTKVDWCNKAIIDKLFTHLHIDNFTPIEGMAILDIHNYDNDMKYNIREYDSFPETVKWEMPLKFKVPKDVARYEIYKEVVEELKGEKEEIDRIVKEFRAQKGERRGNPNAYKTDINVVPEYDSELDLSS